MLSDGDKSVASHSDRCDVFVSGERRTGNAGSAGGAEKIDGEILDQWRKIRELTAKACAYLETGGLMIQADVLRQSTRPMFVERPMSLVARVFGLAAFHCVLVVLPAQAKCPFAQMPVEVGTPRLALETQIAALLGESNVYSPYGNNLTGGTVSYRSADCELRVTFAPGAPAPRVTVASGGSEHLPPIDETVLSHEIILNSSKRQH